MKTLKHLPTSEKRLRHTQPLQERSDEELLAYYRQSRNKAVIGLLFRRYAHQVLGTCLRYLKNPEDARDASADIFAKLCDRLDELQIDRFGPWLHTVTRNHCLKLLERRLRPHLATTIEFNPNQFVANEELPDFFNEQLIERLSNAIDQLNEDQRRCIILFFLEQQSYKEIAAQTIYDLKQVKSHIQNGKRNLRIALNVPT